MSPVAHKRKPKKTVGPGGHPAGWPNPVAAAWWSERIGDEEEPGAPVRE
jgi:hypothetical protein